MKQMGSEVQTALYLARTMLITATHGHLGARPVGTAGTEPSLIRLYRTGI